MLPRNVANGNFKARLKLAGIFFIFGLLGIYFAMALDFGVVDEGDKNGMGHGFRYFFITFVWVHVGSVLSLLVSFASGRVGCSWWAASATAFLAGVSFFYGILLAAIAGGGWLFYFLPPALFFGVAQLLRLNSSARS